MGAAISGTSSQPAIKVDSLSAHPRFFFEAEASQRLTISTVFSPASKFTFKWTDSLERMLKTRASSHPDSSITDSSLYRGDEAVFRVSYNDAS